MIIEVSQNELKEDGSVDDDILAKEIESWKDFRYALREEDALLFDKMLYTQDTQDNGLFSWYHIFTILMRSI